MGAVRPDMARQVLEPATGQIRRFEDQTTREGHDLGHSDSVTGVEIGKDVGTGFGNASDVFGKPATGDLQSRERVL